MKKIKRIGIITGGGDCPGLNAAIHSVVRCAINQHGWEIFGFKDGYRGLILNDYQKLDNESVSGLLDKGGTILGTSNRDNPFHFQVDLVEGEPLYRDMSDKIFETIERDRIDAMVIIGGDGTLTAANIFSQMGISIIGIPKTIDNDLCGTDFSFGFHTAVVTASKALDNLHNTAESHHRLMVLEVMGRYAGWIALYAGMSSGADIILIPELCYEPQIILDAIQKRINKGKLFSLIVVSEGVKPFNGEFVTQHTIEVSPDPIRLGGIGPMIADELEEISNIESRSVILGHLQRGGHPIPFDRILATRFGAAAIEGLAQENFGKMVALCGSNISTIPLNKIAGRQKTVPFDHELIKIGQAMNICFGCNFKS